MKRFEAYGAAQRHSMGHDREIATDGASVAEGREGCWPEQGGGQWISGKDTRALENSVLCAFVCIDGHIHHTYNILCVLLMYIKYIVHTHPFTHVYTHMCIYLHTHHVCMCI